MDFAPYLITHTIFGIIGGTSGLFLYLLFNYFGHPPSTDNSHRQASHPESSKRIM